MESQPQNPEFKIDPENFHPSESKLILKGPLFCLENVAQPH